MSYENLIQCCIVQVYCLLHLTGKISRVVKALQKHFNHTTGFILSLDPVHVQSCEFNNY